MLLLSNVPTQGRVCNRTVTFQPESPGCDRGLCPLCVCGLCPHTQSGLAQNTRVNTGVSNDANQSGLKVFECSFELLSAVSSCQGLAAAAKGTCRELVDAAFNCFIITGQR